MNMIEYAETIFRSSFSAGVMSTFAAPAFKFLVLLTAQEGRQASTEQTTPLPF
jgi:hypothetical protein